MKFPDKQIQTLTPLIRMDKADAGYPPPPPRHPLALVDSFFCVQSGSIVVHTFCVSFCLGCSLIINLAYNKGQ